MNIRKLALTLYAGALLALVSTPVMASSDVYNEAHEYSTHGDWTVQFELQDDGKIFCAAVVENRLGETFDVTLHQNGYLGVYYWFDNSQTMHFDQNMKVVIHGVITWTLEDFRMEKYGGNFIFSTVPKGLEFALDLKKGTRLSVTRAADHPQSGIFSLRGSAAAMDSLYDCWLKIKDHST